MKAVALVKQGKTATLGKLYHSSIPAFGPRGWSMTIPGTPTGGPFGKNALVYHDELVTTEIGQIGTQFDGPGHIGVRTSKGNFFYNGRMADQTYERGAGSRVVGMGDLGVEHVAAKGFVCRGVLLDAAAYRGVKALPIPTATNSPGIVTAADVRGMIQKQGIAEHRRGRLRVPLHRPRRSLAQRRVEGSEGRREGEAARAIHRPVSPGTASAPASTSPSARSS